MTPSPKKPSLPSLFGRFCSVVAFVLALVVSTGAVLFGGVSGILAQIPPQEGHPHPSPGKNDPLESTEEEKGFRGYMVGAYSPWNPLGKGTGWAESFETEGVSWRPLWQEGGVTLHDQVRTAETPHGGGLCESLALDFARPGFAMMGHYVDYPMLFNETAPAVWVRSDHSGVTFGMLVVLPKTLRPDTGKPLSILLPGSTYTRTGEWERLYFPNPLRSLLDQTVQAIRGEQGIAVDPSEAYIRQVVLFVEPRESLTPHPQKSKNGGRIVRLWVDDLTLAEHLPRPLDQLRRDELDPTFSPINLLAFRFQATNSAVVFDSAVDPTHDWPEEPFRIGSTRLQPENPPQDDRRVWYQKSKRSYFDPLSPVSGVTTLDSPTGEIGTARLEQNIPPSPDGIVPTRFSRTAEYLAADRFSPETIIAGSGTRPAGGTLPPENFSVTTAKPFPQITFNQQIMTFGGKMPTAIRGIEYQGEPLPFLKSLGFNVVWLKTPPSAELLDEAKRLDLWLITPPPVGGETVMGRGAGNAAPFDGASDVPPYFNRQPVGVEYDSVLVWDLGAGMVAEQAEPVRQQAAALRQLDPNHRPIVAHVQSGLAQYTLNGATDVLLLKKPPILTSLDLIDYGRWLRNTQYLGTPEFPYWNEIQTEPDPQLLAQCRFFGAVEEMPGLVSYEQIRQQVRLSMAANIHGLLFASSQPLDSADRESQYRAAALELINLELILLDAWLAGGTAEEPVDSEDMGIGAAMMRLDRTSLLVPLSVERDAQWVFGQAAANNSSFIVPVRDGYSASLLLPGNLRKVPSYRRAGGIRLDMNEISMNSVVFLAQSEWYTRVMAEKSPKLGNRMATLAIRLAKMRLDLFRQTLGTLQTMSENGQLPVYGRQAMLVIPEQATLLDQSCRAIGLAEEYLAQDDPPQAYLQAERATREIRLNERRFWQIATRKDLCRPLLPVSVSFPTLPAYLESFDKIANGHVKPTGPNRLLGGDMERSDDWSAGQWVRYDVSFPGIGTGLRRDRAGARTGENGLILSVQRVEGKNPVEMETVPLRVEVPVAVHTGERICVQGWFKIPQSLENGTDGFMISENHGGIALAQRWTEATDWRPFAFYRYAAFEGDMKLNFSLSGFGEVWLDDIVVQVVQ